MRALRFDGKTISLDASSPVPEPAPGEALIRVTRAAVTRLDLDAARPGSGFTGILGHEFVGVAERIGAGGASPEHKKSAARGAPAAAGAQLVGKRVVGAALVSCGVCDLCTRGLAWHCREGRVAGLRGRDGCIAERFCLPVASLAPVPEGVDDDSAVFVSEIAQALHNAQHATGAPRAGLRPAAGGERAGALVTVVGDGPIGLLTAQALARQSKGVRVVGRHERKMALCEKWGINARHERDAGRRADQDVVIDCSGSASGLALACAMVRPRGRIVLCSRPQPAPLDLRPVADHEIELVGSRGGSVGEALSLLGAGAFDVASLIGRRCKLDDAAKALHGAAQPGEMRMLIAV